MLPTLLDLEELIKKFPGINDLDFTDLNEEELLTYLYKKLHKKLLPKDLNKEFINYLNLKLDAKNQKIILNYLRYFILISKLHSKNNVGYIEGIKQINEFNKFQKESMSRIKKLKKELVNKYPVYDKLINIKFDHLISEFEDEFNHFSSTVEKVNNIKFDDVKVFSSFNTKKGRPKNMLFDAFLMGLDDISEKIYPDKKFDKIIKPFFTYIANRFPDILDIDEVKTTEQLRQKVKHLKSANKKKTGK